MPDKPAPRPVNDGFQRIRAMRRAAREVPPVGGGGGPPGGPGGGEVVELPIDPKAPLEAARRFVDRLYMRAPWPILRHYRGDFYQFRDNGWHRLEEQELRNAVYLWLEKCRKPGRDGGTVPCHPNARFVTNLMDALKAVVPLGSEVESPCWLPREDPAGAALDAELPPTSEVIAVRNGIVHLPEGLLFDPTPQLFTTSPLPHSFDEHALTPARWLRFLDETLGDDAQAKEALQDWFGYCLTPSTRLQKILFLVGPPRSGKSTIAGVLTALIGPDNVCSPGLSDIGKGFGLEPLINKSLAIVPDARLGKWSDQAAIVENLLSVSGEDHKTVQRKHQPAWIGRLTARIVLVSNELPQLGDSAGAFASRLILVQFTRSFLGSEDPDLLEKLTAEMPGILNWAIVGSRRVWKRRRLVQPDSGRDALGALSDLGSEIGAFLRDRCEIGTGPEFKIGTQALFDAYTAWRTEQGYDAKTSQPQFGRRLRAACPTVKVTQPRDAGARMRVYSGIRLKDFPDFSERDQA